MNLATPAAPKVDPGSGADPEPIKGKRPYSVDPQKLSGYLGIRQSTDDPPKDPAPVTPPAQPSGQPPADPPADPGKPAQEQPPEGTDPDKKPAVPGQPPEYTPEFPADAADGTEFRDPNDDYQPYVRKEGKWEKVGDPMINIDGTDVRRADVVGAYRNMKNWQAANTQKAQQLRDDYKSVKPFMDLAQKIKGKPAASKDFREFVADTFGDDGTKLLDAALALNPENWTNPLQNQWDSERTDLQRDNAVLQGQLDLIKEGEQLRTKHQLRQAEVQEVINYCADVAAQSDNTIFLTLEQGLLQMRGRSAMQAPPPPPKVPAVPDKAPGAKVIRGAETAGSYSDVSKRARKGGLRLFKET